MNDDHAIKGIHHITLVAARADRTIRFYTSVLGLRLVKKTVNFDRPTTYHLYFGDQVGAPGTLVTFFEQPDAPPARLGVGTTHHLALTVDSFDALLKWKTWLQHAHLLVAGPYDHRAYRSIIFTDPDGVILEIATREPGWQSLGERHDAFVHPSEVLGRETWPEPVTEIAPDMAIRGLHHLAALGSDIERTDAFYQELLCMPCLYRTTEPDTGRPRWYWSTGSGDEAGRPGTVIIYSTSGDLVPTTRGHVGHGMAHHFAFEVGSDDALGYWRDYLGQRGVEVTDILDRKYFRSIYFHDPDGHLLEIATTLPGFLVDEPADRLGEDLTLPAWLEPRRAEIEASLPPLGVSHPPGSS
ncbi:MAG: VOC family protein [Chloroflexi bacterium]|nr:VOC family protein [Chloroflexota bacterium]